MPRVTHVKKAQQRYATKPVLNPDGTQKQTPVMRNGAQRVTKKGKPVFLSVTVNDTDNPLPLETCDYCRKPIEVGTPYKHMTPKSGPYGGRKRSRHEGCPNWQVWEYSNSLSARIAQIQQSAMDYISGIDDPSTATDALSTAAEEIRSIASEKEEGADNIESGFGHETVQSQELREVAENLNAWADEVEQAEIPDLPEAEEQDCETCNGLGEVNIVDGEGETCETCDGTGQVTPDEPTEVQMDAWRDEVESAMAILDESPV